MRTQDFISTLREAPARRLVFTNPDGATIHGGYHLTELKAASFDTVDCGAKESVEREHRAVVGSGGGGAERRVYDGGKIALDPGQGVIPKEVEECAVQGFGSFHGILRLRSG
jgi:hypothetical protein